LRIYMKPKIVVVGSSNTDLVMDCENLPSPGETIFGKKFYQCLGGKGANQAVAAARAGAKVCFIGRHGNDDFGHRAKRGLRKEGIDVSHFRECTGVSSGVALILLGGKERQNMISVSASANGLLKPKDIRGAKKFFQSCDCVVAQLETPLNAVHEAATMARLARVPFVLNPAPASKLPLSLLRLVDTLTPNEHEVRELTGIKDIVKAAEFLKKKGCRRVVVTLGPRGVLVVDERGERRFSAPKVQVVDTVGAGDCFTGWLSVGIAERLEFDKAVTRAIRAASLAVTRNGAQDAMPYRREIVQ
jgi:ribokinase